MEGLEALQRPQALQADCMDTPAGASVTDRLTCEAIGINSVRKSVAHPGRVRAGGRVVSRAMRMTGAEA
jgi:hypothetical protein